MIHGIARMAKECVKELNRLDCATHNIANINTPGFKAERMFYLEPNPEAADERGGFVKRPVFMTDYSPGVMQKTGNALDCALKGDGFFVVMTDQGEAYTRNGRFALNENGELVTQSGHYVMGNSGKITVSGSEVHVDGDGTLKVDGSEVNALKIVEFDNAQVLENIGMGLLRDARGMAGLKPAENPAIQSESLELSNVQAIKEMVAMININRSFETYQKTMQTLQDQDKLSTNRIGRVG